MWTADTAAAWVAAQGIRPGGPVHVDLVVPGGAGMWFPDMPDRVAVVVPTPGGGLFMGEGQYDRVELQLFIRGPQGDPATAAQMAQAADRLLIRATVPAELPDGTYLLSVDRGARPTPTERGRDGGRVTYAAIYTLEVNDEEV